MKKLVTILFLALAGIIYFGLIVSYIGCRFLPSNAASSFCSCEKAIVSSLNQQEIDHPLHDGMVSKVQGDFSINLFNQHSMLFLEEMYLISSAEPFISGPDFSVMQGFVGSVLRPPAIVA